MEPIFDDFVAFSPITRLFRPTWVTEKIDGTNAQVIVSADGGHVRAASRTKLITPEDDNKGFARWVQDNAQELLTTPRNSCGWGRARTPASGGARA